MALPTNYLTEQSSQSVGNVNLATVAARTWFLGCGVGCATGLSAVYAILAISNGQAGWHAASAFLFALIHATVISVFWLYRDVVYRRIAVMASMLTSSILLFVLTIVIGNRGIPTSPLLAFAFVHLILAFFHPLLFATNTKPA